MIEKKSKEWQKSDYTVGVDVTDKFIQILGGSGSKTVGTGMDALKYSEILGKIMQGKFSEAASDILSVAGDKLISQMPLVGRVKTAVDLGHTASQWLNNRLDKTAWETLGKVREKMKP